jgi:hypothetical protein
MKTLIFIIARYKFTSIIIFGLAISLTLYFFVYSDSSIEKTPGKYSETRVMLEQPDDVLQTWGSLQASIDIIAGKPKFYVYGLVTEEGIKSIRNGFKKHGIEPFFEGCAVNKLGEYDLSYNKTIKNAYPKSAQFLSHYDVAFK